MINWQNITTALFDMDGTVLDLRFDSFFWSEHLPKKLSELKNINLDTAKSIVQTHSESIYGTLPWYCVDNWSKTLGIDVASLKPELKHLIQFRPHVKRLLTFLQSKGIQVLLITNAHPSSLSIKMNICPLEDYFDDILSSHEVGFEKENPNFWLELSLRYPINPDRTIFFDDNETVLQQAKSQRIKYLYSIDQPDSASVRPASKNFPSIRCFSDLMP